MNTRTCAEIKHGTMLIENHDGTIRKGWAIVHMESLRIVIQGDCTEVKDLLNSTSDLLEWLLIEKVRAARLIH